MGLFQNLLETYEKCSEAVGIVQTDSDGNINEKKTLLPIFHMTFKSEICVTVDANGNFVSATRDNKPVTIIIPCTESSSGRASGIASHPLCDQLDYVGGFNEAKTQAYLNGLYTWKSDNALLNAVYCYVSGKTIISDLSKQAIFKDSEYDAITDENIEKQLNSEKIRKIGVRFAVQLDGDKVNVWESLDLRKAWNDHIKNSTASESSVFDYLSGEPVSKVATNHPKNINSITGNAKLLSCNDTSGFTFRGRFAEQNDAIILDYVQSQKMHQILRWLIANYGYAVDTQVIVTWAVNSDTEVKEKVQSNSFDLADEMVEIKTEANFLSEAGAKIHADYAIKLKFFLQGYGNSNNIKRHARKICIAVFDAATTGRMGTTFYQELTEDTYLENIINWHNDTSYYLTAWKKGKDEDGKDKELPIHYIGAPSFKDILVAVYGRPRGGNDTGYNMLKKRMRKQLLECMFGNFAFPKSMVEMAVNRASHPMSFTDSNGKFDENNWRNSVNITCALIRKYNKETKEELPLELDEKRTDRDYLFGRLLSVADKMEDYALYKSSVKRSTNALKLMSAFQVKPYSTWGQLFTQLIPYKNQLGGAGYYQSLIDGIMTLFKNGDYENNSPLSPLYLLGYSAQNRALSNNNKNNKNLEVDDNGNITE